MEAKSDKIISYIESFLDNDYSNLKENLNKLLADYKRKSKRLDKIIVQSDKQQNSLLKLNEELDEYKNRLEEKVEEEITKRKEKEKMLLHQSKLAAMAEMMDAVAHQWKQPVNVINLQVDLLGYEFEEGKVDAEHIKKFQDSIFSQINHMTDTLNEFRSFFRPNKEVTKFDVKSMVEKVLFLVKDEFIKNKIDIKIDVQKNFEIVGIENEFKHLVLNIINNAKDAFNERKIQNREIKINILSNDIIKSIEIIDNAGGIPDDIIKDIFKANVTTKAEDKGTGIGLYMSSQIASKHHGVLSVENVESGAKFTFKQEYIA